MLDVSILIAKTIYRDPIRERLLSSLENAWLFQRILMETVSTSLLKESIPMVLNRKRRVGSWRDWRFLMEGS